MDDSYAQLKIALLHKHIPRFERRGILEHNEQKKTLRYYADKRLEQLLDRVQGIEAQ